MPDDVIPAKPADDTALRQARVRRTILRTAVMWTPVFAVVAVMFVYFVFRLLFLGGGQGATWFLVIVLGLFGFLFGAQAIPALMDIYGAPADLEGKVSRQWSRSDSVFWRTFYVRIGKKILRGAPELLIGLRPGTPVTVTYYPHTAIVITLERSAVDEEPPTAPPEEPEPPAEEAPESEEAAAEARSKGPRGTAARPEF